VQSLPREGTKLREIYDLFQANKGLPIAFKSDPHGTRVANLINFYGLDLRCIRQGKWVLAGEWFGKVYVDYIAQRVAA
jgi:hypothetical protein